MDDCCLGIISRAEKKADFLHYAVKTYIRDAQIENSPVSEFVGYNKAR
jgi:hypothetical protein